MVADDIVAIVTFVFMVALPFVFTILAKMLKLKFLMLKQLKEANERMSTTSVQ